MFKTILVPHAGTAAGNQALVHAKEMAKKHGSSVTVLHIVENIPVPPSLGFSAERKKWGKELQAARREMKIEMHEKLTKQTISLKKEGIPVTVKVIHGYPDEEIIRIANNDAYDIVIMAKRRKLPGLKAILKLGSISRKALEKIPCPVMLIDGERKQLFQILREKIGSTAKIVEDYGGYEITITDNEKFPWVDVFSLLLDSGFQIWINKTNSYIQIMSKPEVN